MPARKRYSVGLVWLRRDLRLEDNSALAEAAKQSEKIAAIFIFDTKILGKLRAKDDRRVTFIFDSVRELDDELRKKNSGLVVLKGDPRKLVPEAIEKLGAEALFYNEDYEPAAIQRDESIRSALWKRKINSHATKDQVIFAGYELKKSDGTPYRVFTPYKNLWLRSLKEFNYAKQIARPNWIERAKARKVSDLVSLKSLGFDRSRLEFDFQMPGRKAGKRALRQFLSGIDRYHKDRDFPAIPGGTSGISAHLRFGTISIRECVRASLQWKSVGSQIWLNELIWREFYQMILCQFPSVVRDSFKPKYRKMKWPGKQSHFKRWCDGNTGFPLIDAAMRQLNQTGWMHNRLRMVVASFLVKDLLIDWRKGEAYFAEKLLDFDLASNNGGWQWCASTGCDSQPYFRIFHPISQSERYDKDGEFIKRWVPELAGLSDKSIHFPSKRNDYPQPIVDHAQQRLLALKLFKRGK